MHQVRPLHFLLLSWLSYGLIVSAFAGRVNGRTDALAIQSIPGQIKAYELKVQKAKDVRSARVTVQAFKNYLTETKSQVKLAYHQKRISEAQFDSVFMDVATYLEALNSFHWEDLEKKNSESTKRSIQSAFSPANREEPVTDPILLRAIQLADQISHKPMSK